MSIQINGIDKPKSCFDCPCIDAEFEECAAKEHYLLPKDEYGAVLGEVPDWCPITELQTCEDAVSRRAAVDAAEKESQADGAYGYMDTKSIVDLLNDLPSVQPPPEEDCDTCKYGYFGDRQCDNCRVRYPSHYEREEEHHEG